MLGNELEFRQYLSKLIERVALFLTNYNEYLKNNKLLTESQSGFRPMLSTEAALLEAKNEWLWNIDNNLLNGVIFLDLKKPFDTMDHAILLGKLKLYGVSSQSLSCFQPYLSDRKQQMFIDGVQSIFGPLLFTIYLLMISLHVICFQKPECMQMIIPLPHLQKTHVSLTILNEL